MCIRKRKREIELVIPELSLFGVVGAELVSLGMAAEVGTTWKEAQRANFSLLPNGTARWASALT